MKKVYLLLTVALLGGVIANAQLQQNTSTAGKQKSQINPRHSSRHSSPTAANTPASVIWTNDFSNAADWTMTHGAGTTDDWSINSFGPSGSFPIAPINTTGDFAIFDSDAMCSGNQIGQLTNATPINLTGHANVRLSFSQYYRRFHDSTYVYVSNNGSSWTRYEVNTGLAGNSYSANNPFENPDIVYIDISAQAGNEDSVYIRFEFFSPNNIGGTADPLAGCGYSWMIDDVSISDIYADDAYLLHANGGEYAWIPATQFPAFQFRGRFHNWGLNPISGARIVCTVTDQNSAVVATDTTAASGTVNPGDTSAYLMGSTTWQPTDTTDHTMLWTLLLPGDMDNANDTSTTIVRFNDSTYARENWTLGNPTLSNTLGVQGDSVSFGTIYQIFNASDVTSATFILLGATPGDRVSVELYTVSGGVPSSLMGTSGAYTLNQQDSINLVVTLPFTNPISVTPGDYCLVLNQLDTNGFALGFSSEIYTPQKGFFRIGASAGTWTPLEAASLFGSLMLDLNNPSGTLLSAKPVAVKSIFNVYPNPSNGIIYVSGNEEKDVTVEVTNSLGQLVKTEKFDRLTIGRIDLHNNPSGLYNVHIKSASGEMTKSIVLQ